MLLAEGSIPRNILSRLPLSFAETPISQLPCACPWLLGVATITGWLDHSVTPAQASVHLPLFSFHCLCPSHNVNPPNLPPIQGPPRAGADMQGLYLDNLPSTYQPLFPSLRPLLAPSRPSALAYPTSDLSSVSGLFLTVFPMCDFTSSLSI